MCVYVCGVCGVCVVCVCVYVCGVCVVCVCMYTHLTAYRLYMSYRRYQITLH